MAESDSSQILPGGTLLDPGIDSEPLRQSTMATIAASFGWPVSADISLTF